jgi:glutathione-independent formaldehyde dehydrogenase
MPSNRGVVYLGPGKVEVQTIDFPKFRNRAGKPINHGVILKVVATNICGSDQHMVRGRTTAPAGMVLGHEVTGEIIEVGSDVEYHRMAISYRFRSTWLAAAAAIAASSTPVSA